VQLADAVTRHLPSPWIPGQGHDKDGGIITRMLIEEKFSGLIRFRLMLS
jgi:hypothetical protein